MKLLALDQASRTSGWSVFEEDTLIASGTFTVADEEVGQRLVKIRNKIIELIKEYNVDTVAFEDIQLQGQTNNVHTHKVLAEVFGVVEELLAELGVTYQIVHSQTWKSGLGIKGTNRDQQKKAAQAFVLTTYNKKVSQDESDAICIGAYTIKNRALF